MFSFQGVPQLNALVFVQIHIKDINNYAPVFTQTQSYKKSVNEREETGGYFILSFHMIDIVIYKYKLIFQKQVEYFKSSESLIGPFKKQEQP